MIASIDAKTTALPTITVEGSDLSFYQLDSASLEELGDGRYRAAVWFQKNLELPATAWPSAQAEVAELAEDVGDFFAVFGAAELQSRFLVEFEFDVRGCQMVWSIRQGAAPAGFQWAPEALSTPVSATLEVGPTFSLQRR